MCRHRGVEVAQGSGNTKMFMCPYHGWSYDLEGKLAGAAYMRESEGFEIGNTRLPQISLKTWRGNIFINFAAEPADFETALGGIERDFAFLQTDKCRLANVTTTELACNWKFFHENLMDYYHVGVLHAKTFGAKFAWSADNLVLKDTGGLTMHYKSAPSTPGGVSLFGKMPWLADRDNTFACTGFFPPNITMFARIDCVKFITAWPLGADRCEVRIYMLFPQEFHADPDFVAKVDTYCEYQNQIYEEDRSMIESMQRNMALPEYQPGRLSTMEKPIHHFLGSYVDRMFADTATK
jgi:Rieske 2Fe-2S family protein